MSSNNDFKEQKYKESQDDEISFLFDDARRKLETVKKGFKDKKTQIVSDLAKKLEGKIPTDTISIEIVTQLLGIVSERFVRECLPEEYKQKHRIENAKKQKKKQEENNLAAVTPLNKEVIIVDTDGRNSLLQADEDNESSKTVIDDPRNDQTFVQSSSSSQQQIEYHDDNIDNNSKEPNHNEIKNQNLEEKDTLDKPSSITDISHKEIVTEEEAEAITYEPSYDNDRDYLPFEFSWSFKELRSYLTPLYSKIGDNGRIWFSGRINKSTGQVHSHHFGRLNQQQQRQQIQYDDECADRTDRDDAY